MSELKQLNKPPYKGGNNMWLTESLFYNRVIETPKSRWKIEPVFDLYDERPGLINARTTFVNLRDPTGRKWALTYLGDWNHWLRLMRCAWFREAYDVWLTELNLQLKSEAIAIAIDIMKGKNGAQALAAAKFIATQEYDKSTKGRPSKMAVEGELKRVAEALSREDEDLKRIGLTVITGGKRAN